MEYELTDKGLGYVSVILSGEVYDNERILIMKEIKLKCEDLGIHKILIDLNQATVRTTHLEDFNFGTFLSDYMKEFKIASFSAEFGRVDFVNRVTKARHMKANRFRTREDAVKWLNMDQ